MENCNNIIYSICMINLNMSETIFRSVSSIASQLDDRFEIILLDGGSSDGSQIIINKLAQKYRNIKPIFLNRDYSRKIGMDRNLSAEAASGEYLIFNLDCDDIYQHHIIDWVKCFHVIEHISDPKLDGLLISGCHINMVSKKFFLNIGKFKNVFFEDRDLWMRAATINKWINWSHENFVTRLPRNRKQWLYKGLIQPYYAAFIDYHHGLSLGSAILNAIKDLFSYQHYKLIKFISVFLVRILPNKLGVDQTINFDPITFSKFANNNRKSLRELLNYNSQIIKNITFNTPESTKLFLS